MANFAFLHLMPSTGLSNSESQVCLYFTPDTSRFSKKSKIQSHNLAPAILEGLMPITTEEEPEDVDDDAPSRVRIFPPLSAHFMLTTSFSSASRLSELSMGFPQICLQRKFSQLSGPLLCNISLLPTPTTDVELFSPLVFALRDAVNI